MGQSPKTSFIPKQTTGPGVVSARSRKTFNLLTFLATVVFLAVLILSVGVFLYERYNEERLTVAKEELAGLREGFETSGTIDSIRALERKMKIGEHLLDQHVALSRLFDALEARIQSNASLSGFAYTRDAGGVGRVTLRGTALSFNTVALQERGFSEEQVFEGDSVLFSGLNTGSDSMVTFTVDADLNPGEVRYEVLTPPDSTSSPADVIETSDEEVIDSNENASSSPDEASATEATDQPQDVISESVPQS